MTDDPEPRAVTVALQKGGVGKTTVAINVAERLDARGHDVLLVDLDQQGNATEGVGLAHCYEAEHTLGDVWDADSDVDIHDLIRETEWMDVVPSHRDLDEVENQLRTSAYGVTRIRNYVVDPLLGDEYDYIVVDSPPSIGPLSDSALVGTQNVIVPLKMREASISGFQRMVEQQLRPLRDEGGIDVRVLAIVPNILEGDGEEKRIIRDIEDSPWADRLPAFARSAQFDASPGPGLRKRVAFGRAYREGKPLAAYDSENDQLPRLDELADIVERGAVDA
ncbi:ParA family protein [Halarchaeum nitratireducens]|uniref:Chromosome partitioning protein ParA n=1 Tax=Halarchaeum nitratireducens TaxID=489913 RepID=A0A830GES9_9EURY|nr:MULTISPECIES: ParA family protein [Halarchaeum]MBP2252459.1 chromosome partitioning protein [Halarchaeum solikamskense]GGN21055.1 chromosome partitioning protein ParA [Halarchaeum nitratireducens]